MALTIKKLITRTNKKDLALLIGICALIIGVLIFQQRIFVRNDFYVAHHFGENWPMLKTISIILGALYLGLWAVIRNTKISAKNILVIASTAFILIAGVALVTHPTRSQDLYHSLLLGKGLTESGLNPYTTAPQDVDYPSWNYPVLAWKDVAMPYGPIWSDIVIGIAYVTSSLGVALVLAKSFFILVLAFLGFLLFKLAQHQSFTREAAAKITALFLLNPFIIQTVLIDGHSDILVGFFLMVSLYLLSREKYGFSILALAACGLVKYSPFMIMFAPVYLAIRKYGFKKIGQLLAGLVVSVALVISVYHPFDATIRGIIKLVLGINLQGLATEFLPGTTMLIQYFHMTPSHLRIFGIVAAIAVLVWALHKKKIALAYTMPFIVFFFFATTWFQAWYVLWLMPVIFLAWPSVAVVLMTALLLPMPELISPSMVSYVAMTIISVVLFFRYLSHEDGRADTR